MWGAAAKLPKNLRRGQLKRKNKIVFFEEKKSFKTNVLNLKIIYVFSPINYNFLGLVLKKNYSNFALIF